MSASRKWLECMVAWTPGTSKIKVGPWPDKSGWSDGYSFTGGACYLKAHSESKEYNLAALFIEFNTIVVRDCVPYQVAHRAFLHIEEYRRALAPDTLGAERDDGTACNTHWETVVRYQLPEYASARVAAGVSSVSPSKPKGGNS